MILSAGLSPAWQQTLVFDSFEQGEVNRAAEAHWCASGKVINAGVAAHRLSGAGRILATAGGRALAEMEDDLTRLGIVHRWVETAMPTRVCTTIVDRRCNRITELVENARPISETEQEEFLAALADDVAAADAAILIGSLPDGVPVSLYPRALAHAPCPVVLDFRGPGLLECLELKPLVVKPNRQELAQTIGSELHDDRQLLAAMRSLNEQGARWVLVTQGAGPAFLTSPDKAYRLTAPPAKRVVNPIGCGDAMAAGLAWGAASGHDMLQAARLGMAAAQHNLRSLLPGRFETDGIEATAEAIEVEAA